MNQVIYVGIRLRKELSFKIKQKLIENVSIISNKLVPAFEDPQITNQVAGNFTCNF